MSSAHRRFVRAALRAQQLPVVVVALTVAVVLGSCATGSLISVPGLSGVVPVERFFPAVLAVIGALLPAVDWGGPERDGARSVLALRAGRFLAGLAVAWGGASSIGGGGFADDRRLGGELRLSDLAVALFAGLVVLLVLVRRGWWLAAPVLCYAQFYLDDLPWLHARGLPLVGFVLATGVLYVLRGPGGVRGADLLPE